MMQSGIFIAARKVAVPALLTSFAGLLSAQSANHDIEKFAKEIRPVLAQNCGTCHNPAKKHDSAPFLKANGLSDMEKERGLWRNVATQLRNRTMPPVASKLTEEDRLNVASWIDQRLRLTACGGEDFAGSAITRRLNRREYRNTIRDLLGVDLEVTAILPADGTGGAGFDTNGETLYIPPVLMERYLETAQQILDRVIATPPVSRTYLPAELKQTADREFALTLPVYLEDTYDVRIAFDVNGEDAGAKLQLKVDGADVGAIKVLPRRIIASKPVKGPLNSRLEINLSRGTHTLTIVTNESVGPLARVMIMQVQDPASPEKRATHHNLFGMEPGEQPVQPDRTARLILQNFVPKAFRRPVELTELDPFFAMYKRSAERGDPYEESVKLALKTVLVHPEFLFRIEQKHTASGIYALSQYELATRLSYFLWSTLPDDQLLQLAKAGRLQDTNVLKEQVERMLDDPRSRSFTSSFIGQWLGTQDIGGRVVPLLTELQAYYTPETAADLRAQPILLLERIISEDRNLLELLTADYTHLTQRLAKFYQVEDQITGLSDNRFTLVKWPDHRRAGLLGLGSVLAMTSRYKETSPVLRGAWALETLLGTPVPPPPPDVPTLDEVAGNGKKLTMREKLSQHRDNPTCAGCHRLMDPIGFGLENFDWMGRWRETEEDGRPVDASGELPSGEKFNGIIELREALLSKKDDFVTNFSGRVLGYALGRSLQDGDDCTIQKIVQKLKANGYRTRSLITEIVLSTPFRNTQGGNIHAEPITTRRAIDISSLNALKQDNESHNNQVKVKPEDKKKK